jgi:hypothetical protein
MYASSGSHCNCLHLHKKCSNISAATTAFLLCAFAIPIPFTRENAIRLCKCTRATQEHAVRCQNCRPHAAALSKSFFCIIQRIVCSALSARDCSCRVSASYDTTEMGNWISTDTTACIIFRLILLLINS